MSKRRCGTCMQDLSYGNPEHFRHHLKICPHYFPKLKEEHDGQIKCKICARNFLNMKGAFLHLSSTHFKGKYSRPKPSHICKKCGKRSRSSKHEKSCAKYFNLVEECDKGKGSYIYIVWVPLIRNFIGTLQIPNFCYKYSWKSWWWLQLSVNIRFF